MDPSNKATINKLFKSIKNETKKSPKKATKKATKKPTKKPTKKATKKTTKKASKKASKKISKKAIKKVSKKVAKGKHILCKNDICANTRTIFHSPRMKNTQQRMQKIIYYFYNLDDKKLYRLRKEKYDMLKDKRGYLLQFEYEYIVDDFDKIHRLMTDIMVFIKYTKKEEMSKLAGITPKTPYSFGWNFTMVSKDLLPKIVSIKDESKTVDKSKFDNYIQDTINKFKQEFDFSQLKKLNAYEDIYANLLDKYYNECQQSNVDVFKIKYMA